MWYHIKIKPSNGILSKTTFWLGGDSEEEIYKILKRKHNYSTTNLRKQIGEK